MKTYLLSLFTPSAPPPEDLDLGPLTDVSPRRAVSAAEAILDAVVDIQANLRRELVLANLFSELGSEGD